MRHIRPTRRGGSPAPTTALVVVAKAPVPGQVKTRLCPPLAMHQAAVLACAALLDTMDAADACADTITAATVLVLAGDLQSAVGGPEIAGRAAAGGPAGAGWRVVRQRGRTFGERLHHAHLDGGAGRATLQIGMDTPQVSGDLLTAAVQSLWREGVDAVLGPSDDGGWWALGLRPGIDAAFLADVPMSTTDTGALTLQAMARTGLRVAILPTLTDVDTIADGHLVAGEIPASRFAVALDSMLPTCSTGSVRR